MRTFIVPALDGESFTEFVNRASSMHWQFIDDRALQIPTVGTVILDGDKPAGSDFQEVTGE